MSGQRIVPILDANRDVYVHGGALIRHKVAAAAASSSATPDAALPLAKKELVLCASATIKILQPAPKPAPVVEPNNNSKSTKTSGGGKAQSSNAVDPDDAEAMVLHRAPPAALPPAPRPTFVWRQLHAYVAEVAPFGSQSSSSSGSALQSSDAYGFTVLTLCPAKTVSGAVSCFSKNGILIDQTNVAPLFTSRNKILDCERTASSVQRRRQCTIFPSFQVDVTSGAVLTRSAAKFAASTTDPAATWCAFDLSAPCIRVREYLCHTAYEQEEWSALYHTVLSQYWQSRLETGAAMMMQQSAAAGGGGGDAAAAGSGLIKAPGVYQVSRFALDLSDIPERFFLGASSSFSPDDLKAYLVHERRGKPFPVFQLILSTETLFACPRKDATSIEKDALAATAVLSLLKLELVRVLRDRGVVEIRGKWDNSAVAVWRFGFLSPVAAAQMVLEIQRIFIRLHGVSAAFPHETI